MSSGRLIPIFMGAMLRGLTWKSITRDVMILIPLKVLESILPKKIFQANFANIQSTSGTVSNIGALKALAKSGDSITAVSTADGGHISHARMGAVGLRDLNVSTYPWDEDRMEPDVDASCALIREMKPKITLVGQSVFLFPTPLKEMADAAHESRFYGYVRWGTCTRSHCRWCFPRSAAGRCGCDDWFITQNIPGAQGGFLLSSSEDDTFHRRLNNAMFPGVCSSYHLHHVAGKVVALAEFEAFGKPMFRILSETQRSSLNHSQLKVLTYSQNHEVIQHHIKF